MIPATTALLAVRSARILENVRRYRDPRAPFSRVNENDVNHRGAGVAVATQFRCSVDEKIRVLAGTGEERNKRKEEKKIVRTSSGFKAKSKTHWQEVNV